MIMCIGGKEETKLTVSCLNNHLLFCYTINMNTLLYLIVCHKAFKYTHFNILVLVEIQLFALYNCLTQLTHEYMHCQQQIQVKTLFLCRAQNGSALVVVI